MDCVFASAFATHIPPIYAWHIMNCYRCGRYFRPGELHLRRKVKTGERYRKQYKSSQVDMVQATFGMRIVCKFCAKQIDREDAHRQLMQHAGSLVLLLALVLLFILQLLSAK